MASFAGVLLAVGISANAVAAFNFPALIELLQEELSQDRNVVVVLNQFNEHSLTEYDASRLAAQRVAASSFPLADSWPFLLYGNWLVVLAALGVLYSQRGALLRRLAAVAAWVLVGIACSAIGCGPRLLGEFHWYRADRLQLEANYSGSLTALENAVSCFPELGRLQRTWRLRGELDYCEGRSTPESQFWQAGQYLSDSRLEMAGGLMEELGRETNWAPPVGDMAGRLWVSRGMRDFGKSDIAGAGEAMRKAADVQDVRLDCLFCLGVVQAHMDRVHPERAEAEFASLLVRCGYQLLSADALKILGDAYFDADDMREARARYGESWDTYNLLGNINCLAQKGLGGL